MRTTRAEDAGGCAVVLDRKVDSIKGKMVLQYNAYPSLSSPSHAMSLIPSSARRLLVTRFDAPWHGEYRLCMMPEYRQSLSYNEVQHRYHPVRVCAYYVPISLNVRRRT